MRTSLALVIGTPYGRGMQGQAPMTTFGKDRRPDEVADWLKRRAPLFHPADPWLGKHAVEYRPHKISLILTRLALPESGRHWHLSICFRDGNIRESLGHVRAAGGKIRSSSGSGAPAHFLYLIFGHINNRAARAAQVNQIILQLPCVLLPHGRLGSNITLAVDHEIRLAGRVNRYGIGNARSCPEAVGARKRAGTGGVSGSRPPGCRQFRQRWPEATRVPAGWLWDSASAHLD